jgi:hypothetical protein
MSITPGCPNPDRRVLLQRGLALAAVAALRPREAMAMAS